MPKKKHLQLTSWSIFDIVSPSRKHSRSMRENWMVFWCCGSISPPGLNYKKSWLRKKRRTPRKFIAKEFKLSKNLTVGSPNQWRNNSTIWSRCNEKNNSSTQTTEDFVVPFARESFLFCLMQRTNIVHAFLVHRISKKSNRYSHWKTKDVTIDKAPSVPPVITNNQRSQPPAPDTFRHQTWWLPY